ncbi:unnamed protein product [Linum tenue]|uniref:Bet v I/Major latex protein domain-containing protein n=1 Tax=Linum tenue TaxID=586396 RepID=A0AAV0HNE4_9ROSI|nr:unnamed protein product [Linum tenue]
MPSEGYKTELKLVSSANDVWGAIFAATRIYPAVLPDVYEEITSTRRDGYSEGSMRKITYSPAVGFNKAARMAMEEITDVDHETRTVSCSVEDGEFVTKHYRSFETTTTVAPLPSNEGPREPGCIVRWSCSYVNAAGSLSPDVVKDLMNKTFEGLDNHLQKLIHSKTARS